MNKKQLKYAVIEATILKKIDHPFIIKLYYSFQTQSNLYLVLDYCPYGNLLTVLG
jgi:protein-serine/threonine kinase